VSVLPYRQWDPERRFVVTKGSRWQRDGDLDVWVVSELWRFEQGSGREILAVTLRCVTSTRPGRRMSQSRLVGTMREVTK